jgi:hypothetical protein
VLPPRDLDSTVFASRTLCSPKQHIDRRALMTGATLATAAPAISAVPVVADAAVADPVVAMCGDWHALHREMIAAYDRVPDELGDAYEAAQAEAEAIQAREQSLYEQIVAAAPMSVAGVISAASVAAADLRESYALDKGDQSQDIALLRAYRILVNIARLGAEERLARGAP